MLKIPDGYLLRERSLILDRGTSFDNQKDDLRGYLRDLIKEYNFLSNPYEIRLGTKAKIIFDRITTRHYTPYTDQKLIMFDEFIIFAENVIVDPAVDVSSILIRYTIPGKVKDLGGVLLQADPHSVISSPIEIDIEKVIYHNPATIVIWNDGTKTVVKCQKGDTYDPEKGLALCLAKKALLNSSRQLNDVLKDWAYKGEKEECSVKKGCPTCRYADYTFSMEPCKSCDDTKSGWKEEL